MRNSIHRRAFHKASAAGLGLVASTAAGAARIAGANERIRLGFIGVANRGGQLLDAFMRARRRGDRGRL